MAVSPEEKCYPLILRVICLYVYPCCDFSSGKKGYDLYLNFFIYLFFIIEPGSTPRNLSARPLSASTMVIQWDEPQELSGLVTVISHLVFLSASYLV